MGSAAEYAGMGKDELIKNLTRDLANEKRSAKNRDLEIERMFEQQSALVHLVRTLFEQLATSKRNGNIMMEQWNGDFDRLVKAQNTNDWLIANAARLGIEEAKKKADDSDQSQPPKEP